MNISRGHRLECPIKNCIFLSEDCFVVANSVDPDEMQHYHYLSKYAFRSHDSLVYKE